MKQLTATQRQLLIKRICLAPQISNADIDIINAALDDQEVALMYGGIAVAKADLITRLARAEQLLLDEGLAIDRYETDGSLVYEDDEYVVDSDGCYLPRLDYEAFAVADATPPPGDSGQPGAAAGAADIERN